MDKLIDECEYKFGYKDIRGWFDFEDIYDWIVRESGDYSHFVEVGSCFGRSTAYLALKIKESRKQIRLDAVDMWPKNYNWFFANMIGCQVNHLIKPMRMPSHLASFHYPDESLDFVFIDADHSYEEVKRDIISWFPKIKPNGFLAGHDYHIQDVKNVVNLLLANVEINNKSWVYRKK